MGSWTRSWTNMCRFLLSLILTLGAAHAKVCRPGWTNSDDGQCFKAFSTPKSWRDAEAKCVSEGGHLAKIMNRQQQSTVLSLLDHQPWGIKLWIGGTEAAKAGEWRWTDGTLMTYTSWAPGMPRLGTGGTGKGSKWNGECTLMHGLHGANRCYDGGWYDSPCSGRAPFVCSEHGTPQTQFQGCPSGWQFSEGACFRGFCERKTWNDAQASCKAAGGNLAKISNCAHESTVRSLIGSATTLWIGLTEQGRPECDWCWAGEKTSIKMRLWAKGEPNNFIGVDEECGAMGFNSDKDQSLHHARASCHMCAGKHPVKQVRRLRLLSFLARMRRSGNAVLSTTRSGKSIGRRRKKQKQPKPTTMTTITTTTRSTDEHIEV